MRVLVSLFLLIMLSQSGYAETDEYSVSIGYSSDSCGSASDDTCMTHFDELANGLFKKIGDGIPLSYFDDDQVEVTTGLQYLYCAALSDHVNEYQYAPIFYDNGMRFIDKYAKQHAVRDLKSYKNLSNLNSITMSIPKFHQSWLINDKNVLKGVIFSSISSVIESADIPAEGDMDREKIKKKMKNSYKENCIPLK